MQLTKNREIGTKVIIKVKSGNCVEGKIIDYLGLGFYKVETCVPINNKKVNRFHEVDFHK